MARDKKPKTPEWIAFGHKIQEYRERLGLTIEKLAEKAFERDSQEGKNTSVWDNYAAWRWFQAK